MKTATDDLASLFLRGTFALARRARAERPVGSASLSGLGILGALQRLGPLVATRLAAEQRLAPQSLTRILADLEAGGLIARTRSATDGRAITIAITDKGRKTLLADIAARRAWLETALVAALTPAERQALLVAAPLMLKLASHQTTEG